MAVDLATALMQSAQRLGIDPVDLGTAISYETAGTFDPWKAGPTTKWGQHRGLIQWGEPQRERYGVYQGMPLDAQLQAVESYLTDAGVKPGHGLLDIYSAINAGRVGRYGASDAAAGGAPGTVRDKVEQQMAAHRQKAAALLQRSPAPAANAVRPVARPATGPAAPAPGQAASIAEIVAPAPTQTMPAALGDMAAAILAQRSDRRRIEEERAAAEQARRAALFGVGGLYG